MSCRSTAGGRAASRAATYLTPGKSRFIPQVLHALIREESAHDGNATASFTDVETSLLALRLRVRTTEGSPGRQTAAIHALDNALHSFTSGQEPLPSRATVRAWQQLPNALATHQNPTDAPYHQQITHFHPRTLAATNALFTARPSRLAPPERRHVCEQWVQTVSNSEQLPPPTIVWEPRPLTESGGGYYISSTHSLHMRAEQPSLLTLFHEHRHAQQFKQPNITMVSTDKEDDARAWSMSLFHQVRPRLFARLVNEGRIFHISPADL
jgi:hypothetical protein